MMSAKPKPSTVVTLQRPSLDLDFSSHFGLVQVGGKAMVADLDALRRGDVVLMPRLDFLALAGKAKLFAKNWLDGLDPVDEVFSGGLVFDPSTTALRTRHNELNTWKGWPVPPDPHADWSTIYDNVRNDLCAGDQGLFDYVFTWIAQLIQQPHVKPGTALVLKGEKTGTGKSSLGTVIGHLMPKGSYVQISSIASLLSDPYNGSIKLRMLFCQCDEAIFGGSIKDADQLKSLITDPLTTIRIMRTNPFPHPFPARFLFTSNRERAVHIEDNDRRYSVVEVVGRHRTPEQHTEFFKHYYAQLKTNLGGLMHSLLQVKPAKFEMLRRPYDTGARQRAILSSMPLLDQVILGELERVHGVRQNISRTALYSKIAERARQAGFRGFTERDVCRRMRELGYADNVFRNGQRTWLTGDDPYTGRVYYITRYPAAATDLDLPARGVT